MATLNPIKPPALNKGDTIGIFAPSSYVEKERVETGKRLLEEKGYNVYIHPQSHARHNQSAGTSEEKISALHDLFKDPAIKAIMAAGGGNRAMHILGEIDYGLIAANPKIFIGFSDITTLLNAIYTKTGLITFHGPVLTTLEKIDCFNGLLKLLSGNFTNYPMENCQTLKSGNAAGQLIGGNLNLLHYLAGGKYMTLPDRAILFLEDTDEELSHIDKMLLHLKHNGIFDKISGLICGEFSNLKDSGRPFGFTMDDLLLEHTKEYDIPVVTNAPFGHGKVLYTMPVGITASLTASDDNISLALDENAVTT